MGQSLTLRFCPLVAGVRAVVQGSIGISGQGKTSGNGREFPLKSPASGLQMLFLNVGFVQNV